MMNLKTFFKNIFNTKEISDDNIRKFAQTHVSRLTAANTGGIYTPQLTAVQALYTAFANAINAEDVALANQQGSTITADDYFYEFKTAISQKEGIVRGIFGVNSAQYQAFFPEGLSEYSAATKGNVEMLMNRIVQAATLYNASLTPDFLPLFTANKTNYINARNAQLQNIGGVEVLKSATAVARQALTTQLMKNLLIIASNNVGDTTLLEDFFDQSFIRSNTAPDDGSIQGTVAPTATVNIENTGLAIDTDFTLTNTGTQPLKFGIETADNIPVALGILVAPNATIVATYLQLLGVNPPGSMFLNVTNTGIAAGSYSVLIE